MAEQPDPVPYPKRWKDALLRGETAPIPVVRAPTRAVYPRRGPSSDDHVADIAHASQIALRIGTLLLAGGAPTEDVEAAMFAVGTALGLPSFEVDITYNSIIISIAPDAGQPGLSDMRVVRGRSTHYARVAAAHQLVLDLSDGLVPPSALDARIAQVEKLRKPFQQWISVPASGALSAAITVGLGGNARTALAAFLTASCSGFLGERMARRGWPTFFANVSLALFATLVAVLLTATTLKSRPRWWWLAGSLPCSPG